MRQHTQEKFFTRRLLREPLTWIFYCFFQPTRFSHEIEVEGRHLRRRRMYQLFIPLFIGMFPLALITQAIVIWLAANGSVTNFIVASSFGWLIAATLLTLFAAVLVGSYFGLVSGITWGIAGTFGAVAVVFDILTRATSAIPIAIGITTFIAGITYGIAIGSARDIARSSKVEANIGSIVGLLLGIPPGILLGIAAGGLGGGITNSLHLLSSFTSAVATLSSAILGVVVSAPLILATRRMLRARAQAQVLSARLDRGLSAATVAWIAASALVGGLIGGATSSDVGTTFSGAALPGYLAHTILIVPILVLSYELGYYRLPLYLASGWSSLRAYRASRKNPPQVFVNLRRSALYWDECVFLPLPYLTSTLYLAIEQGIPQTLGEITHIIGERPTQITEARAAVLEIALRDLEERETLRHIAQASDRLASILTQGSGLLDPRWLASFARLNDASREAARYLTLMSRQERRNALDEMILNLKRVSSRAHDDLILSRRLELSARRLELIAKRWSAGAVQELDMIAQVPEFGSLDNPYISGAALKTQSQQFVGRRDLVRQIEDALRRGENRPCFFLTGERRMGKTSTLNQLPVLLSARCVPLTFDLQARGTSANAAVFLSEIAHEVGTVLDARGIRVPQLDYETLNNARRENEAMAYRVFDRWLSGVERDLEQKDRVLLVAFDEFEKFEEAGDARFLDMQLLLDWFRSVIQHRPHMALLFSGVKSPGEMDSRWAGHFVNVKTLRVSFLNRTDARQLISRPVPDYPSESIFGEGVIDEILAVTGCHPFLVQAVCSELIDILNADRRDRAVVADVKAAVEKVLESWGETYFRDLWERTDQEQRACLRALKTLGKTTAHQIQKQCELEAGKIQPVLQALCKRDLVCVEQERYQLALPIFHAWLEMAAE